MFHVTWITSKFNRKSSGGGGGGLAYVAIRGCAIILGTFLGVAPRFLGTFLGYSRIFGYHFFGYSRICNCYQFEFVYL